MTGEKSVNEWLSAENYLYNVTPVLFIIGAFVLFLMIFLLLYVKKKEFKLKMPLLVGGLVMLAGMTFYLNIANTKHGWYRRENVNVTSAMRDRQKKIFGYNYQHYTPPKLFDKARIEATGLYDSQPLTNSEGITYVGETEHLYYFKIYKKLYNISKNADFVVFTEETVEPRFIGFNYTLKDKALTEIGFKEEIGPLYTEFQLPKSMENQIYDHRGGKTEVFEY
ncbi:hypothetical protein [Vagococcus zengguangii]|uniref:Uncharacterized protein n=1 Tax=Vagococcus zengguangii TaxID=2571750 RepID=A0A4D7CSR2_9ENTE|nr:hypothetical protein [Vagococcus zengguangii]QCI86153.1 hypothetical protein FA707_03890 [Vagococcus zengguangii]TLG79852.1 hypothetical protein FE258_07295 [Vagococcus zengguangii]